MMIRDRNFASWISSSLRKARTPHLNFETSVCLLMKKFKEWQAYSTDFYNRFLEVGLSVRFIYWILNLLSRRRFGNLIADYLFICSLAVAPFQSGTGFCSRFSAILYYTCSAVDAAQRTIPLHRRTVAGKRQRKILEKGRPDERHRSVGWTGFRENDRIRMANGPASNR